MSDQIQLMFAAAAILIMKALYALHWSHIGLNLPAWSIYHVVDMRLLSAEKIQQCLLRRQYLDYRRQYMKMTREITFKENLRCL